MFLGEPTIASSSSLPDCHASSVLHATVIVSHLRNPVPSFAACLCVSADVAQCGGAVTKGIQLKGVLFL